MIRCNLSELSLGDLRGAVQDVYRRGDGSRPDVMLIGVDDEFAVLKDHGACDPWFARLLGPLLSRREARALERLGDVRGVPGLLARPDSRSLLIEYLPATALEDAAEGTDWRAFFVRLDGLLADMHSQGIAHCDLRSPYNTMISAEGEPFIVDFVASVSRGRRWNVPANLLFERFARADREAIIKLKKSAAPYLVTESEESAYASRSAVERVARWIGATTRNLSRKLFTRS